MTAADLSRASGLREELVTRFVPPTSASDGARYGTRQLGIARAVRQLTDVGVPVSTIVAAVEDLNSRSDNEVGHVLDPRKHVERTRSCGRWAVVAAGAVIILLAASVVGGLIGRSLGDGHTTGTPVTSTVTVATPTQQLQPAIPKAPDPVCAEWGTINDNYRAKRSDWTKTDPTIPASQWSPEQRSITMNVIPVLRSEATDLRGLASRATDPTLRFQLQLRVLYLEAFADRLPNYAPPSDRSFWVAATDTGNIINSLCTAVGVR